MGFKANVRKKEKVNRMTEARRPIGTKVAIIDKMISDSREMIEQGASDNALSLLKNAMYGGMKAKSLREFWIEDAQDYYPRDLDKEDSHLHEDCPECHPSSNWPCCPHCDDTNGWEVLEGPKWDNLAGFSLYVVKVCNNCRKEWTEFYDHSHTHTHPEEEE